MAFSQLPDLQILRNVLLYEPDSGRLFWKERPVHMFPKEEKAQSWNKRFAGAEAFTHTHNGYKRGLIFGKSYLAHRIAWKIEYGQEPDCIDHINGDRSDNRICNLRSVSASENTRNTKIYKTNNSSACGVYWHKVAKKWAASIGAKSRRVNLGLFSDLADAVNARKAAELSLGYHENHGRDAEALIAAGVAKGE